MLNIVHKISDKILIILLSVILLSCNGQKQYPEQSQVNSNKVEQVQKHEKSADTIRLSNDIDSVEVTCVFFEKHREFILNLSETYFHGSIVYNGKKKFAINSLEKRNRFVDYINRFYIEKSDFIVLSKSSEPAPVTDYPYIRVKGFKGEKEVLNKDVTLYSNIEFHPKFIEFYEFLEELVSE